jgi:hypothetical protein
MPMQKSTGNKFATAMSRPCCGHVAATLRPAAEEPAANDSTRLKGAVVQLKINKNFDFPSFMTQDIMGRMVKTGEVKWDDDLDTADHLGDTLTQFTNDNQQYVRSSNERVIVAAARWVLHLAAQVDENRRVRLLGQHGQEDGPILFEDIKSRLFKFDGRGDRLAHVATRYARKLEQMKDNNARRMVGLWRKCGVDAMVLVPAAE